MLDPHTVVVDVEAAEVVALLIPLDNVLDREQTAQDGTAAEVKDLDDVSVDAYAQLPLAIERVGQCPAVACDDYLAQWRAARVKAGQHGTEAVDRPCRLARMFALGRADIVQICEEQIYQPQVDWLGIANEI